MKNQIAPPPPLVVRKSLASHPIINPSAPDHKFGVIFTTLRPGEASPDDFTPAELEGATVENLDLVGEDPFFQIVGGYFCTRFKENGERKVNISHLFGVATDPSQGFNLSPGNHILGDEWRSEIIKDERAVQLLDERKRGENGWTLIVAYRPLRRVYPDCHRAIRVFRQCPVVGSLTLTPTQPEPQKQSVTAQLALGKPAAEKYLWTWGDGNTLETTTPQATHTYDRLPGEDRSYQVEVEAIGPGSCKGKQKGNVSILGFCPDFFVKQVVVQTISDQEMEVQVEVGVNGGILAQVSVDWGDGSPAETHTQAQIRHRYRRDFDRNIPYQVRMQVQGPGTCTEELMVPVDIAPPPCPILGGLTLTPPEGKLVGKDKIEHTLALHPQHGALDRYTIDWGDGSSDTITGLQATHVYGLPAGDPEVRIISVQGSGPGDCPDPKASIEAPIPGVCPTLSDLTWQGKTTTDKTFEVIAQVAVKGPMPDQFTWHWGDDSAPETTTQPQASHVYTRPAGDQEAYTVTVSSRGPDSCQGDTLQKSLEVPGRCPVLTDMALTVTAKEGNTFTVAAQATIEGPSPTSFEWDWGDGGGFQPGNSPQAKHVYTLPYGSTKRFLVTLRAAGPDSCSVELQQELLLQLPCSTSLSLGASSEPPVGLEQKVQFEVAVDGPEPHMYEWHWGDGSAVEQTSHPAASHTFAVKGGEDQTFLVKVQGIGPDECSSQAKLPVAISGVCPVLHPILIADSQQTDPNHHLVEVKVAAEPLEPGQYTWHWGDDSPPETTDTPTASHSYARAFGQNQVRTIRVETTGPGTCAQSKQAAVSVPGRCPEIAALTAKAAEQTRTDQGFDFHLEVKVGAEHIDHYEWDFGDWGEGETTSEPNVSFTYAREIGQDRPFTVKVRAVGPGTCLAEAETVVTVPGGEACPEIIRLEAFVEEEGDDYVTLSLMSVWKHGTPPELTWNFGDGSPSVTSSEATVYHTYEKQSIEQLLAVSLQAKGPQDCQSSFERKVRIPAKDEGPCPQLLAVEVIAQEPISTTEMAVTVAARFAGQEADSYRWTWDASQPAITTQAPRVKLTLPRSEQSDRTFHVKMEAIGPDDCRSEGGVKVVVPQPEPKPVSPFCRLIPYLLAFLGSLAMGALLIVSVGGVVEELTPGGGLTAGIVLAVAVIAFVIVWILAHRRGCPPTYCDKLAIGWATALGGLVVSFYLLDCFNWIPFAIGFFIGLGVLLFFWFRDCARQAKTQVMFIFLAVALAAAAIDCLLIARTVLLCC